MKLTPLGDRVVLKQLEAETTTKSGIVLTTATQEKPQEAEVVAVGPGTEDVKMEVSVGQKVIYSKYAGTEVKLEDEEKILQNQVESSGQNDENRANLSIEIHKKIKKLDSIATNIKGLR
jgi:chaperonin GroES